MGVTAVEESYLVLNSNQSYMLGPTFTTRGLAALTKLAFKVLASIISAPEKVLVNVKSMLRARVYLGVLGMRQRQEDAQVAC